MSVGPIKTLDNYFSWDEMRGDVGIVKLGEFCCNCSRMTSLCVLNSVFTFQFHKMHSDV